jgi:hypothetical protein
MKALSDLGHAQVLLDNLLRDDASAAWNYRLLGNVLTNRSRALAATGQLRKSAEALAAATKAQLTAFRMDPKGTSTFLVDQFNQWTDQVKGSGKSSPSPEIGAPR